MSGARRIAEHRLHLRAVSSEPVSRETALEMAFRSILDLTPGRDAEGTRETPSRCARAWVELTSGYEIDVASLFKTFEKDGYDEMIVVSPIAFSSLCEHHLLPFVGQAHVVYVPDERVVGLSKIPRLVEAFARRLQIQERMTVQIADAMEGHLHPLGILVLVEASHSCCASRGARKAGVTLKTSAVRGVLRDKPETRAEALALIAR